MRWNGSDLVAIALAVGALALGIGILHGGAGWLLRCHAKRWRGDAIYRWVCGLFVCYLCLRTSRMILEASGASGGLEMLLNIRGVRYGLYVGLPLVLSVLLRIRFVRFVRSLCLLGSIMGALYFASALTYTRFENARRASALPDTRLENRRDGGSMFLLIFDECGYNRVYPGDQLRRDLPHFREFAAGATVYRKCYSEGTETPLSIPRLLLKDDSPLRGVDARNLMRRVVSRGKLPMGGTVFADAEGVFRSMSGLHVDFDRLVADEVEHVETIVFRMQQSLFEKVLRVWLDAFPALGRLVDRPVLAETDMFIESVRHSEELLRSLARRAAEEPVFAVCHIALPHYPFVWDAPGLRTDQATRPISQLRHDVAGYEGNLRYMDTMFGRFVEQLKQIGQYAPALLIVTSDHAWRLDPDLPPYDMSTADADPDSAFKHVPLWVKAPGQEGGEIVDDRVQARQLHRLWARWNTGAAGPWSLE